MLESAQAMCWSLPKLCAGVCPGFVLESARALCWNVPRLCAGVCPSFVLESTQALNMSAVVGALVGKRHAQQ